MKHSKIPRTRLPYYRASLGRNESAGSRVCRVLRLLGSALYHLDYFVLPRLVLPRFVYARSVSFISFRSVPPYFVSVRPVQSRSVSFSLLCIHECFMSFPVPFRLGLTSASGPSPYRPKTAFRRVMVSRVDLDT